MAAIYRHGSFFFFIYVCVACLLGIFGIADTGFTVFWRNLFTIAFEILVGAGVTIFFIDRLNDHRATENLKRRLIREAGSRSHDIAISAIEWMDREGWLRGRDGLLQDERLRKARLMDAPLNCANLESAELQSANLSGAELKNTNLKGANLTDAILDNAKLNEGQLQCAIMIGTTLKSAHLIEANLQGTTMTRVDVEDALFYRADFTGATLLKMVNLRCAYFSVWEDDFVLSEDSYEEALKRNANLECARLHGADLNGVNLRMVNMKGAILWSADLRGAKLTGTDLSNADLRGVLLEGVVIHGVKDRMVEGARWTEAPDDGYNNTRLFPKTNFSGATLPDGITFTDEMDDSAIQRFIDPDHPDFPDTLARVKAIFNPGSADLHEIYDSR